MKTQADCKYRIVTLNNLEAMCEHVSTLHERYKIDKVTRNYCYVWYNNSDMYSVPEPIIAKFPIYRNSWKGNGNNPYVVLDIVDVMYANKWGADGECFQLVMDSPRLWHDPLTSEWLTY